MEIIKFGKEGCFPCQQVDEFLLAKQINYNTIDPFNPKDEKEAMLVIENNVKTVPLTILIDSEENVLARKAGFNEKSLSHLVALYNGK